MGRIRVLIDWVTARVPLDQLSPEAREAANGVGDRVCRFCPRTGTVRWTTAAWDSIRSDSHQVSVKVGSDLWIQGSPARVIGDGCSVFGAGASSALDLVGCVDVMRRFVGGVLCVELPVPEQWIVSRVDVTGSHELNNIDEVRQALSILRNCEGGRYRVSQQAGDTVYWSHLSKLRSAKAYAKGPHLVHLMKQKSYDGKKYTAREILQASRLLRLELKLGREYWARVDWKTITPDQLTAQWSTYFERMIGGAEMAHETDIQRRIMAAALTEGRGKAAFCCWLFIEREGWERARNCFPKVTWYRHIKVLHAAGLSDADISAGKIVPLRRRILEARLVHSWAELKAA
jgi:II/X family phage/plasmid replication protein